MSERDFVAEATTPEEYRAGAGQPATPPAPRTAAEIRSDEGRNLFRNLTAAEPFADHQWLVESIARIEAEAADLRVPEGEGLAGSGSEPRLIWCERTGIHTHTFGGPHRCAAPAGSGSLDVERLSSMIIDLLDALEESGMHEVGLADRVAALEEGAAAPAAHRWEEWARRLAPLLNDGLIDTAQERSLPDKAFYLARLLDEHLPVAPAAPGLDVDALGEPPHRRSEPQDYDPTPCCQYCFKPWGETGSTLLDLCPESPEALARAALAAGPTEES